MSTPYSSPEPAHPDSKKSFLADVSPYVDRRSGAGLALGILIGLALGLLIGWVFWPVTWTNALPGDLAPAAQAAFLSSIADGYVAMGDKEEALQLANARLANFGRPLGDAFADAERFLETSAAPDAAIRSVNLQMLSAALGVAAPAAGTAVLPPSSEIPAASSSWARWLFTLLGAVLLVAGGIWLLRYLSTARAGAEVETEEPYAEELPPIGPPPQVAAAAYYVDAGRPSAAAPTDEDDYVFAAEPDEFETVTGPPIGGAVPAAAPLSEEEDFTEVDEDEEEFEEELGAERPSVAGPATAAVFTPVAAAPPPARANIRIVDFNSHYQLGVGSYEESFPIVDPDSGQYIGECGVGVHMKYGSLPNNADHVVALDVWLFDKSDDRQLNTQTRVLISRYVIDQGMEGLFVKESNGGQPPVLAQPATTFQLVGKHLTLDVTITRADYAAQPPIAGIFQELATALAVYRNAA